MRLTSVRPADLRHIGDGTLRRMHDEPFIVTDRQRDHIQSCERCRERLAGIARDVDFTAAAFASDAPAFSSTAALATVKQRLAEEKVQRSRLVGWLDLYRGQLQAGLGSMAAALALVGALLFTPAGSLAQSFITVFQPTQVTAISVTSSDLKSLPNLQKYGTVHAPTTTPSRQVADAAAAGQATGMAVLVPSSLPGTIPTTVKYQVVPSETGSFTFNAAKARRAARKLGKHLAAMPAGIDGSTLTITTGAAAVATYGNAKGDIPALMVGQMVAPRVTSSGVTAKQLEDYLLGLPGISPSLAAEIRAIDDPTSTLPIPIPVDYAHADHITIDGVPGLAIGDSTGLGSAVIWEKSGIIYGVGGPLTESQVISIASSLR